MAHIDIEILQPLVLRIAQGFACKDSAAAANVSPETIRARRKRLDAPLPSSAAFPPAQALEAVL